MSDTRKTWDDLIANFPDNEQRLIDAVHVREFVATVKPHIAARAPTVTDDTTQGFDVGRDWIYETSPVEFYKCESAAQGAAVWRKTYPVTGAGAGVWGSITGTLGAQTDLVNALAGKSDTDHTQGIATITGLSDALDSKSPVGHNHDERYYTESETDNLIAGVIDSLEEVEASEVIYDNFVSGLDSTNAQDAIDELVEDIDALSIAAGVANPLVADLAGDGYEVQDVVYRGFRDIFYDLDADPESLVVAGAASLTSEYNAYKYVGLDSELELTLPTEPVDATSPFGLVSVKLASGGSVVLDDGVSFVWNKTSLEDPDPVLPTTEDDVFTIRYRWEPVIAAYVLYLELLSVAGGDPDPEPEPEPDEVKFIASGLSALSSANKDTHSYTYNYTSTTQDGSIYVYVVFFTDAANANPIGAGVYDDKLTQVAVTGTSNNAIWVGRYKPSSGDLSGGTLSLTFNYTNEAAQILCVEVSDANSSAPDGFNNFVTGSSVTSIGPTGITAADAGALLLALAITDENVTLTPGSLNGFTQIAHVAPTTALGGFSAHYRTAGSIGSVNSPTYGGSSSDRMNLLVLAIEP